MWHSWRVLGCFGVFLSVLDEFWGALECFKYFWAILKEFGCVLGAVGG